MKKFDVILRLVTTVAVILAAAFLSINQRPVHDVTLQSCMERPNPNADLKLSCKGAWTGPIGGGGIAVAVGGATWASTGWRRCMQPGTRSRPVTVHPA
jgi:hypothetical protein